MRKNLIKSGKWGIAGAAVVAAVLLPVVFGSFSELPTGAILPIEFKSPVSMLVGDVITCNVAEVKFTSDGYVISADCPAIRPTSTSPKVMRTRVIRPTATRPTEIFITPYRDENAAINILALGLESLGFDRRSHTALAVVE